MALPVAKLLSLQCGLERLFGSVHSRMAWTWNTRQAPSLGVLSLGVSGKNGESERAFPFPAIFCSPDGSVKLSVEALQSTVYLKALRKQGFQYMHTPNSTGMLIQPRNTLLCMLPSKFISSTHATNAPFIHGQQQKDRFRDVCLYTASPSRRVKQNTHSTLSITQQAHRLG